MADEKKDNSSKNEVKHGEVTNNESSSADLWKDIEYRMTRGDIEYIKKLFQSQKVSMDDVNKFEETLFLLACRKGQFSIASMCLLLGCDINRRNKKNKSALQLAKAANAPHIEQLIQIRKLGNSQIGNKISEISSILSNQNGKINILIKSLQTIMNKENIDLLIDNLTDTLISAIDRRLAFSDDLLMLIWLYHVEIRAINAYDTKIWKRIYSVSKNIISSYPVNEIDFFWLNTYLLKSSLWYYKVNDKDMLFLQLLSIVQSAADKQKHMFLIDPFTHLYNKKRELWDRLMNVSFQDPGKYKLIQNNTIPRQDSIPFGLLSEYKRSELITNITPSTTFSPLNYYAIEIYLPKLVLLGHILDDAFQESIRNIFNINIETNSNTKLNLKYKRGPLKQLLRCKQKSQNDYANEMFPQSAHVLDINRCSLIVEDVESLLNALQIFYDCIDGDTSGNIVGIVRCKNGFNNDEYKFELNNVNYADIKLNVMIYSPIKSSNSCIAEVQFLLKDMMNFKNEAHRMYNIIRQEEFINDVNTILPLMSDITKSLHTSACIGDYKSISRIMIENELSYDDIMRKPDGFGSKTVLFDACKNRELRVLRFLYKLSQNNNENINHFLDKLFDDSGKRYSSLEISIERGTYDLNKYLTTINGLCPRIIQNEDTFCRILNYLFIIDNWSTFLLWKEKLKIDKNVLLKYMKWGINYVKSGKLKIVNLTLSVLFGKTIFHMITENGDENMTIKFINFVVDECEYKNNINDMNDMIFMDDVMNRNVIERCVQRDNLVLLKYLFEHLDLIETYKNDKRLFFRLLCRVILSSNTNIWQYIKNKLNITSETIKNNLRLSFKDTKIERALCNQLPNIYKHSPNRNKLRGLQYFDKNLFFFVTSIDKFELMRTCFNDDELYKLLFDEVIPSSNRSAIEWAIFVNKTKLIKYIFELDTINNKIKNDERILYRMLANCISAKTNEMFDAIKQSLNIDDGLWIKYIDFTKYPKAMEMEKKYGKQYYNTNLFHFICSTNKQLRFKRFKFLFEIINKDDYIQLLLQENAHKSTPILLLMQNEHINIIDYIIDNTNNEKKKIISYIIQKYKSNKSKFKQFSKYTNDIDDATDDKKEIEASSFMEYGQGTNCCICLSAPHGFLRTPQQKVIFSNRKDIKNTNGIVIKTLSDMNTMEVLHDICDSVKQLQMNIVPGYVVLKVHRTYLDGNRKIESFPYCPNDVIAKSVYELYHKSITNEIYRMQNDRNNKNNDDKMLLIDIHGQGKKELSNAICVGTKSGKTCDGNENKDRILSGLLKYVIDELEWVTLIGLKHDDEYPEYSGGYTVQSHSATDNVYAIQLEFGSEIRKKKEKRKLVAKAIAKGIVYIHKHGLYKTDSSVV